MEWDQFDRRYHTPLMQMSFFARMESIKNTVTSLNELQKCLYKKIAFEPVKLVEQPSRLNR